MSIDGNQVWLSQNRAGEPFCDTDKFQMLGVFDTVGGRVAIALNRMDDGGVERLRHVLTPSEVNRLVLRLLESPGVDLYAVLAQCHAMLGER